MGHGQPRLLCREACDRQRWIFTSRQGGKGWAQPVWHGCQSLVQIIGVIALSAPKIFKTDPAGFGKVTFAQLDKATWTCRGLVPLL